MTTAAASGERFSVQLEADEQGVLWLLDADCTPSTRSRVTGWVAHSGRHASQSARCSRRTGSGSGRMEVTARCFLAADRLASWLWHAPDVPARPAPDIQHIVRARGHFGLAGRAGLTER
jgi:hypothetical protein